MSSQEYYYYSVCESNSPSEAFKKILATEKDWQHSSGVKSNLYNCKRYTIVKDTTPIHLNQALDYIDDNDIKLRNNYAGCVILNANQFLFFI